MKRGLLFLGLLVAGLALLVLVLGPDEIVRHHQATEFPDEPIQEGRGLVVDLPGSGGNLEMGFEGSWLELPLSERIAFRGQVDQHEDESWQFREPQLDFQPEARGKDLPRGRIQARFATVLGRGLVDLAQSRPNLRSLSFRQDVLAEWFGAGSDAEWSLQTEVLEADVSSVGPEQEEYALQRLFSRTPTSVQRADGKLRIEGKGGMVLDLLERQLSLEPPVRVEGSDFSMPSLSEGSSARRTTVLDEPLVIQSDGPMTMREHGRQREDAAFGDAGILQFVRNVRVDQEAAGRWLKTEFLEARFGPDDDDEQHRSRLQRLIAGDGLVPVRFGLLGGSGSAQSIQLRRGDERARFDGPVSLTDISLESSGADRAPLQISVAAQGKLLVNRSDEERIGFKLHGSGRLRVTATLAAEGDFIGITARLARTEGDATELEELHIVGEGRLELLGVEGGAPVATADDIRVRQLSPEEYLLHLTGNGRLEDERGYLAGPELVVHFHRGTRKVEVDAPQLTAGSFELPQGVPGLNGATRQDAAGQARLVVEPLVSCAYSTDGSSHTIRGRSRYRILPAEAPSAAPPAAVEVRQEFVCDELIATITGEPTDSLVMNGNIEGREVPAGLQLAADRLRRDTSGVHVFGSAERVAYVRLPLEEGEYVEVFGDELHLTDAERRLLAKGTAARRARLRIPEHLLQRQRSPASPPVEIAAQELSFLMAEETGGEASAESLEELEARGHLTAHRPVDGLRIRAQRLLLRPLEGLARLEGSSREPALLERPVAGASERLDRFRGEWIELREHGQDIGLAAAAQAVFHHRRSSRPDDLMEVEVQAGDEAWLHGTQLNFGGGVQTTVRYDEQTLDAFSERLELWLDQPIQVDLLERGLVNPVQPLRIRAQRNVRLQHPEARCSGALLSYDFASSWVKLKAGAEPCEVYYEFGNGRFATEPVRFQQADLFFPTDPARWTAPPVAQAARDE